MTLSYQVKTSLNLRHAFGGSITLMIFNYSTPGRPGCNSGIS